MDLFSVLCLTVLFGAVGFAMGRNYQRSGRFIPETVHRMIEGKGPLPPAMRGMSTLLMAVFALFMSFMFIAIAQSDYRDPLPGFLAFFCFATYWALVPIWVYRDAKARGERAWAWGLMTLFTNVLGLFSYLITRPEKPRACPRCGYLLREEFVVCPYCGPQAGMACPTCQSPVESGWLYCPFCQTSLPADDGPATFTPSNVGDPPSSLPGVRDLPLASP